ncbi:MAG: hypothetical protein DA328_06840 [Nitrososphaeraceae archaeon]|nr:hypothetical protein [Nitrososphaeraceae archaeon]
MVNGKKVYQKYSLESQQSNFSQCNFCNANLIVDEKKDHMVYFHPDILTDVLSKIYKRHIKQVYLINERIYFN